MAAISPAAVPESMHCVLQPGTQLMRLAHGDFFGRGGGGGVLTPRLSAGALSCRCQHVSPKRSVQRALHITGSLCVWTQGVCAGNVLGCFKWTRICANLQVQLSQICLGKELSAYLVLVLYALGLI